MDDATLRQVRAVAHFLHVNDGQAVALAVRRLWQDQIAAGLHRDLEPDEIAWLEADLGP